VAKLLSDISDVDGFVVLAPEYNGSIPPVLNNAIAWLSVSTSDWREAFNGKPVALGTFSGGPGASVITAMRLQFAYMGANVIGRCLTANGQKPATEESMDAVLDQLF
jgi:chromate reductase, NAD(P)H dehydrogenase (quinone)